MQSGSVRSIFNYYVRDENKQKCRLLTVTKKKYAIFGTVMFCLARPPLFCRGLPLLIIWLASRDFLIKITHQTVSGYVIHMDWPHQRTATSRLPRLFASDKSTLEKSSTNPQLRPQFIFPDQVPNRNSAWITMQQIQKLLSLNDNFTWKLIQVNYTLIKRKLPCFQVVHYLSL